MLDDNQEVVFNIDSLSNHCIVLILNSSSEFHCMIYTVEVHGVQCIVCPDLWQQKRDQQG